MILLFLTILLILLCPSGLLCDVKYSPDSKCHSTPPHPLQNDSIYPWVNSAESWQLPQLRPGIVGGKLPSQAPLRISFPFNFHPGRRRLGRAGRLSYICNIIFPTTHTTELCFLVKWELYFQITDFPPKPWLCPGDLLQWVKPQSSLSGVSEMIQNRIKTITCLTLGLSLTLCALTSFGQGVVCNGPKGCSLANLMASLCVPRSPSPHCFSHSCFAILFYMYTSMASVHAVLDFCKFFLPLQ